MDVDTEEDDDRESLDPEEMRKSSIYSSVRKLSRYYVACGVIISELIALVRSGAGVNIKVDTVPISVTTSTPAKENEYPTLESFLEQRMDTDLKSLDPQKVGRLRDSWPHDRKSQNLFLHAEMQIACYLFCWKFLDDLGIILKYLVWTPGQMRHQAHSKGKSLMIEKVIFYESSLSFKLTS